MNRSNISPLVLLSVALAIGACTHQDIPTYTPVNGEVVAAPLPDASPAPSDRRGSTLMQPESSAANPARPGLRPMGVDLSSLDDEQLAGVVEAIREAELDHMQLALSRASTAEVQRLARDGIQAHRGAMEQDDRVLARLKMTPADSWMGRQVRDDSRDDLGGLKTAAAGDFDHTFVDHQLDMDAKALALLDSAIARVNSPSLKRQFERDRVLVAGGLRQAQDLQKALGARTP